MLTVNTTLGYKKVDFSKDNENYMLLTITGKEVDTESKRPPISVVALLDISSSMSPEYKIGYLKKSVIKLIDNLVATDRLSLIAYSTTAQVLSTLVEMTPENKKKAIDIVKGLRVQSMTNISEALALGFEEFRNKIVNEGVNRIILFTDGCPTAGNTQENFLINLSTKCPDGVQLTTMGYGKPQEANGISSFNGMGGELNVSLMEKMSERGKGNYYYMADPDSCGKAFATELAGLLTVVAQKVKITLAPEKDRLKVLEVMDDVDVTEEEGNVIISIPDVIAGETRYVLLKVFTKAQDKVWARPAVIAAVSTEYLNMVEGTMVSDKASPVKIEFVKNGDTVLDADVKTQVAIIEAIKAQEKANVMASHGDYVGAQGVMYDAALNLSNTGTTRGASYSSGISINSACYASAASFTSNSNSLSASMKALKSGRATGSNMDDVLTTSTQKAFQKDWNVGVDPAAGQDSTAILTVDTTTGTVADFSNGNVSVDVNITQPIKHVMFPHPGLTKKSGTDRW